MAHLIPRLSSPVLAVTVFVLVLRAQAFPTSTAPLSAPAAAASAESASDVPSGSAAPTTPDSPPLSSPAQLLSSAPNVGAPFNHTPSWQPADDNSLHLSAEAAECPVQEAVTQDSSVNQASTCPWVYRSHYDADRYPSTILQAECRCQGCLDRQGLGQDADMECRPVIYRMQVVRRHQEVDGTYKYVPDWYDVPVSCACTRPPTSPGNRPPGIIPV